MKLVATIDIPINLSIREIRQVLETIDRYGKGKILLAGNNMPISIRIEIDVHMRRNSSPAPDPDPLVTAILEAAHVRRAHAEPSMEYEEAVKAAANWNTLRARLLGMYSSGEKRLSVPTEPEVVVDHGLRCR